MEMMMDDFGAYPVDDTGGMDTGMMGVSTATNQMSGARIAPSRSLVVLWFAALALYWFLGYLFKGQR
jgi:hypothetical protein